MLSHDMEKLLTFANERRTVLMQEAAVAHLLSQAEETKKQTATWPPALGHWWRRMTPVRPAYQPSRRSLAES